MVLATDKVSAEDDLWAVHRAMVLTTSNGHFEIVKFLREQFDDTLFDLDDDLGFNGCPLIVALETGNVEIAKCLISSNGFDAAITGSVLLVPSLFSALELGKFLLDAAKQKTSTLEKLLISAANQGQLELMEFICSTQLCDSHCVDHAFSGADDWSKYIYSIERYHPSQTTIEDAFMNAAGGGHLEMVTFLDRRETISDDTVNRAFSALVCGMTNPKNAPVFDQAGVMRFVNAKCVISPGYVAYLFYRAASRSCAEVMKFMYTTGPVSASVVDRAFGTAIEDNTADVIMLLCSIGAVSREEVEPEFIVASEFGDAYVVECLCKSGCISQACMQKSSTYAKDSRVLRFFRQALTYSWSLATIAKCINHSGFEIKEADKNTEAGYTARQCKRFGGISFFPLEIRSLPHVMKLIDLFSMSIETAATEASITSQSTPRPERTCDVSNSVNRFKKLKVSKNNFICMGEAVFVFIDEDEIFLHRHLTIAANHAHTYFFSALFCRVENLKWVCGGHEGAVWCFRNRETTSTQGRAGGEPAGTS